MPVLQVFDSLVVQISLTCSMPARVCISALFMVFIVFIVCLYELYYDDSWAGWLVCLLAARRDRAKGITVVYWAAWAQYKPAAANFGLG